MLDPKKPIGDALEQTFKRSFTGWVESDKSAKHLPDFIIRNNFGIETKASFLDYGAQIKEYQKDAFSLLSIPVFYLFGFHSYANSINRWATVKNPSRDLKRNFDLDSIYVVSDDVIQRMFPLEKRLSRIARKYILRGKQIPPKLPQWYFGLKKRYINQLFYNETSERNGDIVSIRKHYDVTSSEFDFFTVDSVPLRVSQTRTTVLPIRGIVERELSDTIQKYLVENQR